MNGLLTSTSSQKILNYLIADPGHEYLAAEIQKATGISKGGVNLSLRELALKGLVRREKRGKIFLYSVDPSNPVCKQLKVYMLQIYETEIEENGVTLSPFSIVMMPS